MCGISGIFSKQALPAQHILSSLSVTKHRGPDDTYLAALNEGKTGFFSCHLSSDDMKRAFEGPGDCRAAGWIGYNRLSIIDTSANGAKPLYDEAQDCLFLMNGEVYNYKQLAGMFLAGEKRLSGTDTEVAFRLYLKLGDDFVHHLRGMFTIVAIHPRRHTIKVWRDRFGIKPFYYTITQNHFIFSSEINGIFSTGLTDIAFDKERLAHQLYFTGSLSPSTIYKDTRSLEPGHCLEVDTRSFTCKTGYYWQLAYQPAPDTISTEEFLNDIRELAALNLEGVSETGKALMLSGGLDSGLLAVFLKPAGGMEACTLYSDSGRHKHELAYTRLNAQHAGMPLREIRMPAEMSLEMLDDFCLAEEEPNISPEPAYFLSSQMKNRVRILYNALGPDELFYGYGHHVKAKKLKYAVSLLRCIPGKLFPWHKREKLADLKKYGLPVFPFISRSVAGWTEIKDLFREENTHAWQHPLETVWQQAKNNFPDLEKCDVLKQMSCLDIYYYISSYHTFRSDRPAMLHHIEMRFPYLDHLFIQKYFNVTGLDKGLAYGNEKPFFRKHIKHVVDPAILTMKKTGFEMNDSWLRSFNPGTLKEGLSGLIPAEAVDTFCISPERSWLLFSLARLSVKNNTR